MKKKNLLAEKMVFADFEVIRKLSEHHQGEREVYLARSRQWGEVALTVFNLKSPRYVEEVGHRCLKADNIFEVDFFRSKNGCPQFPKYYDSGICRVGRKRLAWMATEYVPVMTLEQCLDSEDMLSEADVIKLCVDIARGCIEISDFTSGGGHYNLTTENVSVRFEGKRLKGVYLTGMYYAGKEITKSPPFLDAEMDNRFRAPESINGMFSTQTDVYSIAMIMVLLLTGRFNIDSVKNCDEKNCDGLESIKRVDPLTFQNRILAATKDMFTPWCRMFIMCSLKPDPENRVKSPVKVHDFLERFRKKKCLVPNAGKRAVTPKEEVSATRNEADTMISGPSGKNGGLDEVAGMEELKSLFRRNFITIIKNPEIAKAYGVVPCNCTLLYGPQGCGKTFIAEKAAQESGLKYRIIKPSDFGSIYVHGSQGKIAEAFKEAEEQAPMILIFDEFDAIAPKREKDSGNYQAGEVNELLTQLNNCADKGVFVLATTNRPDMIDSAVLRTGRVDQMFYVPLPDVVARKELLTMELNKRPCSQDIDVTALAVATENFTCSDLSFVVKECARACMEETIASNLSTPIPISQARIEAVIKRTPSSLTQSDLARYNELQGSMAKRGEKMERPKVGFLKS